MSGKPWNEERKAAQARMMRQRWADPVYAATVLARLEAARNSDAGRATASARMKALNVRMRDDEKLRAKCVRGQKRVRRSPAYRAMQALVMADVMSRPANKEKARKHCRRINRIQRVRRRQWAGRRRKAAKRKELQSHGL